MDTQSGMLEVVCYMLYAIWGVMGGYGGSGRTRGQICLAGRAKTSQAKMKPQATEKNC